LRLVYFGGFHLYIKPLSTLRVPEIDMSVVDYRSCHSFITDGWCSTSLMFFTWGRVFDDIAIRISVAGIRRAAIRSMWPECNLKNKLLFLTWSIPVGKNCQFWHGYLHVAYQNW